MNRKVGDVLTVKRCWWHNSIEGQRVRIKKVYRPGDRHQLYESYDICGLSGERLSICWVVENEDPERGICAIILGTGMKEKLDKILKE